MQDDGRGDGLEEEPLEARDDDADSGVAISDADLSADSLRSSLYRFQMENGMPYHAMSKGKYFLPVNDTENERLDLQNEHFLLTFDGKDHHCPGGDTAKRVLDIGTGTGIWAIQYADQHPASAVIGVDLAPIQPSYSPPNLSFQLDDVEKPWTWNAPFDFIFSRMMVGSFTDWPAFVSQAYENLEPGGWFELIDNDFPLYCDDDTLPDDNPIQQWVNLLVDASNRLQRPLEVAKTHRQRLLDAGFENVTVKIYRWPINTWPKDPKYREIGLWSLANVDSGLEGISMALLTRGLGWTREEVLRFLVDVRRQLRSRSVHAYWKIWVVYGQKPSTTPQPVPSGSSS